MCNSCRQAICVCDSCDPCGNECPIKLDFKCIIYNKDSDEASTLTALTVPNGSTLRLVIDLIDSKLRQLIVNNFSLPTLRTDYTVTNLEQFAEAVDSEIEIIKDSAATALAASNISLQVTDTSSINFSTSGTLDHTLTGSVKVSANANNQLSIVSDGLFSAPQTLSVDYNAKTISITGGNTLNLSALLYTPSGYLGEVASDPTSPLNGNYWFNTAQNKLKIKVNNLTKEIVTL